MKVTSVDVYALKHRGPAGSMRGIGCRVFTDEGIGAIHTISSFLILSYRF